MSDAELSSMVEDWLVRNQRVIDEQTVAGNRFIISGANVVHTLDCGSVRQGLNLRGQWPFNAGLSVTELRKTLHGSGWPALPRLETAEHVNAVRRYKRCRLCCPDVADKACRAEPTIRAGAANWSHIGRLIGGAAVEWIRVERVRVVLGMDDGSEVAYRLEGRIMFDRKVVAPGAEADEAQ